MIISRFVCVNLCKTCRCFNEHLPSVRSIMGMINFMETSKVPPWNKWYSETLTRACFKCHLSMCSSPTHPTCSLGQSRPGCSSSLQGEGSALHGEPCTPQGAFPELSAQSTAKHWHSVSKRVLTWESVRGGLRCCLCFRTKTWGEWYLLYPSSNSAAPPWRAEPLSLGVYDPGKRQEQQQENQDTEAKQAKLVSPPGRAHRAAPAWPLTGMRERKRAVFDAVRFKERQDRFGAFQGNLP